MESGRRVALSKRLTIRTVLELVFPDGTCLPPEQPPGTTDEKPILQADLARPPEWPPDLFGISAYLLHESGHFQSLVPNSKAGPGSQFDIIIRPSDLKTWCGEGEGWAETAQTPDHVAKLWQKIIGAADRPLRRHRSKLDAQDKAWIKAALGLLAIADEACRGVGFGTAGTAGWIGESLAEIEARFFSISKRYQDGLGYNVPQHFQTITLMASPDLFSVQPKSRTPQVGATTRALSHNLALLPPKRRLSASWSNKPWSLPDPKKTAPPKLAAGSPALENQNLNLLLVPFPYAIPDHAFAGETIETTPPKWGWFKLDPDAWLTETPDQFAEFVVGLLRNANKNLAVDGQTVDCLVFPELAMTWRHHLAIARHVAREPSLGLRFLITGSSTNCDDDEGNFEITSSFIHPAGPHDPMTVDALSRPKHHRWRLSGAQVGEYDLSGKLTEDVNWWERIELRERIVNTHAFGRESHFTVLICEDLARADPVHEMVRALGPSLVICLLMDGAQLPHRWPGRYAMSLTEDPGSSILTLTSRALIERSNRTRARKAMAARRPAGTSGASPAESAAITAQSWSVALWHDETGGAVELHCPPPEDAILLRLKGSKVPERTFDGRLNEDSIRWEFDEAIFVRR